jgi:hypothetical protein
MNNQIYFDDISFFQDLGAKDLKLSKNTSNEGYTFSFFDNQLSPLCDVSENKWNSCPANFPNKDNLDFANAQNEDNRSNIADTEEHVPEEAVKQEVETPENNMDTNEHSLDSAKFNEQDVNELLDMINKPSTDMNALLGDVLTAGPTDPKVKRKRAVTSKVKGKRTRKTKQQLDVLTTEFERNSDWTNEDIDRLSATLNLTKKQVYKWFWDQKVSHGQTKPRNW